jgi:mannose-6-phosphate isomerase-like protein (cupin superfamily)
VYDEDSGPESDSQPRQARALAKGQLGNRDADFAVVEWTDSGDGAWEWIAPLHVHRSADEAWYVLEGTLKFQIDGEDIEASPGAAVFAPRGTPHAYGNARRTPARYLLIASPELLELVAELHREPAPGETLDYAAIFARYDSEML